MENEQGFAISNVISARTSIPSLPSMQHARDRAQVNCHSLFSNYFASTTFLSRTEEKNRTIILAEELIKIKPVAGNTYLTA